MALERLQAWTAAKELPTLIDALDQGEAALSETSPTDDQEGVLPAADPEPAADGEAHVAESDDVGPKVIQNLHRDLQVEEDWGFLGPRSLTWWPNRHEQQIWAEMPIIAFDAPTVRVHARTDVLRNVTLTATQQRELAGLNVLSTLNALVHDPDRGTISLYCESHFTPRTMGRRYEIFRMAVALQAAQADLLAATYLESLGGHRASTGHPNRGPRPEPNGFIEAIPFVLVETGKLGVELTSADLAAGEHEARASTAWSISGDGELSVELPFSGGEPVAWAIARGDEPGEWDPELLRTTQSGIEAVAAEQGEDPAVLHHVWWGLWRDSGHPVQTAAARFSLNMPHPDLGHGLFQVIKLPLRLSFDESCQLANQLNRDEIQDFKPAWFLGAWCARRSDEAAGELAYTSFLPAFVLKDLPSDNRDTVVSSLVFEAFTRVLWVSSKVGRSEPVGPLLN
jgi:hypothetical protein